VAQLPALLTPVDAGTARRAGRHLWRKQLLPKATINYKGRRITFDDAYLADLAAAFNNRAYDQVPFQLAPHDNTHTNDPERFRGEVEALEVTADGLDMVVATTEDGSKVLAANPGLGVSARITEAYERADGRTFPVAIQHVLGTLDPRITGMRPWQAIDAANDTDPGQVTDLTGCTYDLASEPDKTPAPAPKETGMALTAEQEARLGKLLDLPDDKFDALITAATPGPAGDGDGDGSDELTDEELQALLDSLPDDDAAGSGDGGDEGDAGDADVTAQADQDKVPAELSADAQAAIDLANARADELEAGYTRMRRELDAATYERERDAYAREHGIPPRIFDLARPVLEGEGRVVDLANGRQADAGAIVRRVLTEIGKTVKMLDLSAELGNPDGADSATAADQQADTERGEIVKGFRALTGV
jgi:hypothetical protein